MVALSTYNAGIRATWKRFSHRRQHDPHPRRSDGPGLIRQSLAIGRSTRLDGARQMMIIYEKPALESYVKEIIGMFGDGPILIDSFLQDAIELDVDCLSDGNDVFVAGIMQHIEEAGIHSGDSACSLPAYAMEETLLVEIRRQATLLAKSLNVIGLSCFFAYCSVPFLGNYCFIGLPEIGVGNGTLSIDSRQTLP